jgi:hypothetical protein
MALTRPRLTIWPISVFGPAQAHGMQGLVPNDDPGDGLRTGPIGGSGWADIASPYAEVTNSAKRAVNRGVVFGDRVFFIHAHRIRSFKYTNTASFSPEWKTEWNLGAAGATLNGRHTGLYPMRRNGRPILACAYYASATGADNWRVVTYEPSGTLDAPGIWAETNAQNIGVTCTQYEPKAEIVWKNKLYFIADSADGLVRWDPEINQFKTYALPGIIGPYDFTPYNGRLLVVGKAASASNNVHIMEVGPAHIFNRFVCTSSGTGGSTENHNNRVCMWTDGVFLHLYYMGQRETDATQFGFRHIVCTGNPDTGEINYVKDASQATDFSVLVSTQGSQSRPALLVDAGTDGIDTQKPSYCMAIDVASTTGTFKREWHWDFNENTQTASWVDTGGIVATIYDETSEVQTRNSCGERTWNEHFYYGMYISPRMFPWWYKVISSGGQPLKIRTSFEVIPNNSQGSAYTFPAGSKAAVSFTYNARSHMPLRRVKLTDPSGGTLTWDDKVIQVVANSGQRYEVTLDFTDEGVYDSRGVTIGHFVALTGVL